MRQQSLAKTALVSAVFGFGLGLTSYCPAEAATFTFTQQGFSGDPLISGTFSGEDANGDNFLGLDELSAFEALLIPSSVSFSLDNLFAFDYILRTQNSIFFAVERQIDVDNGFATSELYFLAVNGFASFSSLVIEFYLDEQLIAIAEGVSNRPVLVRQQGTSVPEPSSIGGLFLLVLLGAIRKASPKLS